MRVILDTNFLIDSIKFKISLDEIDKLVDKPYELFTLSTVVEELKRLSSRKTKEGRCAKLALKLIRSKGIQTIKCKESGDEAIISLADKETMVATNDGQLRKRLKVMGIKTIYLRARKHLGIE